MATVISLAAFQAALASAADARLANDFTTALAFIDQADTINAGLDLADGAGGTSVSRRESLDKLRAGIMASEARYLSKNGGSRIVTGRTNYSKRTNSGW